MAASLHMIRPLLLDCYMIRPLLADFDLQKAVMEVYVASKILHERSMGTRLCITTFLEVGRVLCCMFPNSFPAELS